MKIGNKIPSFVRLLRRRAGLTQRDLAFLLGYRSESYISRLENGSRTARLTELLMLETIFGVRISGVYPALRGRARRLVAAKVRDLRKRDAERHDREGSGGLSSKSTHLRGILASIRRRLPPRSSVHEPWPPVRKQSRRSATER